MFTEITEMNNKIYFHKIVISSSLLKWQLVWNSFSINKFLKLKYLFYIENHK